VALLTAVLDACVLYGDRPRDLLIRLARPGRSRQAGMYQARWTEAIHDEWTTALKTNRPDLVPEKIDRTRALMDRAILDCLIIGYEPLISAIVVPDPKDRHVVAAAIQGKADLIVTINLKDFPAEALAPYNLEAQHPDDFIMTLAESDPTGVLETIAEMRMSLRKPPVTTEELLLSLKRDGLPRVARWVPEALQREKQEMEAIQRGLDELGEEDH
jgi:PIN domain